MKALPNPIAGFVGTPVEPTEGEFNPNGTWTHAVDPAAASFQAIPTCGAATDPPRARHALAGTYRSGEAPGHGLVLQFADAQAAQRWFAQLGDHLAACPRTGGVVSVSDLSRQGELITNHRHSGVDNVTWSESGRVRGDRVILVALGGNVDLARLGGELRSFP